MPIYTYHCGPCDLDFEKQLPMAQYADPQNCPECEAVAQKTVALTSYILKGDGWASKDNRIKGQMAEKNRKLDAKQDEFKKDGSTIKLVPNVGGERVDSWKEASKLAASQGKSTAGYDKLAKS
jgi:putative FmdB family regulatory protein